MNNGKSKTLKFSYNKTPNYRAYNVDGVFGGLAPKNKIFIEFFSEKFPIPDSVIHEISLDKTLGKEIEKKGIEGIVREIECGIYLDIATAVAIADWLHARVDEYKKLKTEKGN